MIQKVLTIDSIVVYIFSSFILVKLN